VTVPQRDQLELRPPVAAGLEEKPRSLEQVVEMTADYSEEEMGL
jgi:hypothetical protein